MLHPFRFSKLNITGLCLLAERDGGGDEDKARNLKVIFSFTVVAFF